MNNPVAISVLARERLTEAAILHQNGKSDGAFYLAGYSVELMLKAKICERFGVPNLFDEQNQSGNIIPGISEIRRAVKTHNLDVLLTSASLRFAFNTDKQTNVHLLKASALLFGNWDESSRYRSVGSATWQDMNEIINLLTAPDGLLEWIQQQ